jgi:hypothetical protein
MRTATRLVGSFLTAEEDEPSPNKKPTGVVIPLHGTTEP